MKTNDFVKGFKNLKNEARDYAKRVTYTNMVSQSLDFLPKEWRVIAAYGAWSIEIRPALNPDGTDLVITADVFEKLVRRITRYYRKEPNVSINKSYMTANWYVYPAFEDKQAQYVNIEAKCGNTEQCELVPKAVATIEYELTGYCKALSEKKFLEDELNHKGR